MNIRVEPGVWVVAVSGGVDSIVLLDLLYKQHLRSPDTHKFVVAHFDHGIRPDSEQDRKHVQQLASQYDVPFVYERVNLGPEASEAMARQARYEFLEKVRNSVNAHGIITAHHKDDALETAVHNILRGTGRRGMTALKNTTDIQRPMLHVSKQHVQEYARANGLVWREDSTNTDTKYMRNYIRHNLLSKFTAGQRAQLAILLTNLRETNHQLDTQITNLLHDQPHRDKIDRQWFIALPHAVAREVVHAWLRHHDVQNIDRKTIERLVVAMKTGKRNQSFPVDKQWRIVVGATTLALKHPERYKKPKTSV